jgi:primase-polymerase (primpol)-like protein
MRREDRWVAWKRAQRGCGGKPTKMPVSAQTGRVTDATTGRCGAPFELALVRMICDDLDGIGFILGDGWVGVDCDLCRDRQSTLIDWWALEIVRLLNSYTEVSPSGRGIKTIVRGALPPGGCRKGNVELYDHARYFTVTGDHLDSTPEAVNERGSELAALHARIFGQVAARSVDGRPVTEPSTARPADLRERAGQGRIRRVTLDLLDTPGRCGYHSPSEADAAIAAGLIGAGLTESEALALLLDSERGRDHARRKGPRGNLAYWQRTVRHAADFVGPVVELHPDQRVREVPATSPSSFVTPPQTTGDSWRAVS